MHTLLAVTCLAAVLQAPPSTPDEYPAFTIRVVRTINGKPANVPKAQVIVLDAETGDVLYKGWTGPDGVSQPIRMPKWIKHSRPHVVSPIDGLEAPPCPFESQQLAGKTVTCHLRPPTPRSFQETVVPLEFSQCCAPCCVICRPPPWPPGR